jgi:phosphate/sulfate permease
MTEAGIASHARSRPDASRDDTMIELFLAAVVILILFAIIDLVVGVSNDAANFLNSSLGSRVAPRYIILIVASLGIMAGVTFSSGMMEVARKGIFHPQLFTMPELVMIFLAVMLSDIILLDTFNTYGLPTSTTVSIVFDLLGAAVAISVFKIAATKGNLLALGEYINTARALIIIFGILLSIVVAFFSGALVQIITRLIFSFNYMPRLKRYGAVWGGLAMASIFYFILIKGAKGASFITPETADLITNNGWMIMFYTFIVFAVLFQILLFLKVNILKPLILLGTFALAMAFAANDLVNFIGVPLAGLQAYKTALTFGNPLSANMSALSANIRTDTYMLLISGSIMVITLWFSRKARTVSETEIRLVRQDEGVERFEAVPLSRLIVRGWLRTIEAMRRIVPLTFRVRIGNRLDPSYYNSSASREDGQRFDLIRASVNMMVASAIISFATSHKLPLSTTYVTFMVSMGSSFSDGAWGRESAVYRITGVLAVVGGWFLTAVSAFIISFIVAGIIFYSKLYAIPLLLIIGGISISKNHKKHEQRTSVMYHDKIFNLRKIKDAPGSVATTFEQMGYLIREVRESLDITMNALFRQDLPVLKQQAKDLKQVQNWCNIITANIFKSMRLLQITGSNIAGRYADTINTLQTMADCHRDIVLRAKTHVDNQHKGLILEQIEELREVQQLINEIFLEVESTFDKRQTLNYPHVEEKFKSLSVLAKRLNKKQISRIVSETSKTRLSILFYAIIENSLTLSRQSLRLLRIFNESFGELEPDIRK